MSDVVGVIRVLHLLYAVCSGIGAYLQPLEPKQSLHRLSILFRESISLP